MSSGSFSSSTERNHCWVYRSISMSGCARFFQINVVGWSVDRLIDPSPFLPFVRALRSSIKLSTCFLSARACSWPQGALISNLWFNSYNWHSPIFISSRFCKPDLFTYHRRAQNFIFKLFVRVTSESILILGRIKLFFF